MIDEEKKEDRRNKVNEYIEQMVTKYIKLSKIVIQTKTETCCDQKRAFVLHVPMLFL